ncbi:hypothetical protein DSM03_103107 [Leeuwenhoekiella aestuarii]|uniref:PKD domain-containing protein n=1 Tax=Leeuwenhoekiella aestuarii TaxID=2249426 RepID=A0A4Q0NWP6_9FLAO|nr:hypothetical protein [Leeuwenhoekiella aestuarii]RXG15922.1 hypothetical protein DSM03_103107 [Leeuwenhoekiella aestuarii]RXG16616.1 hypothetical protein DSM04_102197 [Leeuwenhoekiella aestuarii]
MKILKLLVAFLAVVTVFTGCENDVITNYAFQDISAPTGVTANFGITQDDTGVVTITPVGEGASTFTIYFGVEGSEPETINAGETASYTYTEGAYLIRIVATGSTGLTSEFNQVVKVSFTAPENLSFETVVSGLTAVVTPTADNATMFDVYFGANDDEEPVTVMADASAEFTYAEPGEYSVRVVAKGASVNTIELTKVVTITGAVDPIVLPITFDDPTVNYAFGTFNGASFEVVTNPDLSGANMTESNVGAITNSGAQYEGGAFTLGTPVDFSGANKTITMKFWSNVEVPVLLKFEGGVDGERQNEITKTHSGSGWETLTFDFATEAVKSYIDGNQGVGEPFVPTGQYATMVIFVDGPGTTAGTFYVDDIEQTGGATEPLMAATAPTAAEADVLSVFSDSYTDPASVNYFPNWGQSTTYEQVDLNGNAAIKYGNANYQGIDLGGEFDASAYEFVHIDVWSADYTTIPFFIIDTSGETPVNLEVTAGEWTSIDIPLSAFTDQGISVNSVFQFKFDVQPDNGGTFYIDNLYFYNASASVADSPQAAAPTPAFDAANVISLFSDAYSDVNMATWRTDWSSAVLEAISVAGDAVKKYSELNFVGAEPVSQIDASGMTHFSTDVWTGDATQIRIKLVDFGADGTFEGGDDSEHEIVLNFDNGDFIRNSWVTLDIPLADFTGLTSQSNIAQLIYSGGPAGETTVYVDNVYFHN